MFEKRWIWIGLLLGAVVVLAAVFLFYGNDSGKDTQGYLIRAEENDSGRMCRGEEAPGYAAAKYSSVS